jgi:hypothetical protein
MNMMKTISLLFAMTFVIIVTVPAVLYGQNESVTPKDSLAFAELDGHFTFIIASDLGRNGYYDQKPVAEMMGVVADIADLEFVALLGDAHHFDGIESVHDPLWNTNFEWIYKHPKLMFPWHPVLGNHEHLGNIQAVIDYSRISRRWQMPDRKYAITWPISEKVDVMLLFIDTTPLIDKYHLDDQYKYVAPLSIERELAWIDSTLNFSEAKWKIVMGHHPVYAGTDKTASERLDLQKRLQPLLDNHNVDIAVSGHIHNFQHIQVPGSDVDYFVNTSASLTRKVVPFEGALFGSPDPGFTLCTVKNTELMITFVNKEGEIIYQYTREK